jgi:transposase
VLAIQLSYEGYQISELMKIFKVSRHTIYNWFNNWETCGLGGLYNQPGQGRKNIFNEQQQKIIKEWVKETPKNLGLVPEKILKQWGITASKDTIKRGASQFGKSITQTNQNTRVSKHN